MSDLKILQEKIEAAWQNRDLLKEDDHKQAVLDTLDLVDRGELRCAEPTDDDWKVNDWVKKGVILYFPIAEMDTHEVGIFEYHDKIPLKHDFAERGIRVVPPATIRYGRTSLRGWW